LAHSPIRERTARQFDLSKGELLSQYEQIKEDAPEVVRPRALRL